MRKQKTDILDKFWLGIKWSLIVFLFGIILFNTGIIYVKLSNGVSNGDAAILDINVYSNLVKIKEGDYIDFYRWEEDEFVMHKVTKVYYNEVFVSDFIGEKELVKKENIMGRLILQIPVIRLSGKEGFIKACNFQNYIDGFNQDCDYLYCIGIEKRSQEDCLK